MTVNNGGKLSTEYFVSYLKLIMNARNCSLETASTIMFDQFFKGNKDTFGAYSYRNFLKAFEGFSCCHS
ncbi:hypothetical protein MHB48_11915 [Psychrobacillus sp. FSL H8-0483]|uniref:hypothetical protein n=1 Tax=Psychrobacillus sp. FSL H8-0483 TaxID=2921389 RepID=UPI00315A3EBD